MSTTDLTGQVAFVTGGSSGIGKACAKRLAELGMKVAICARREGKLNQALEELKTISPDVLALPIDVSKSNQVNDGVKKIENTLGPIDILFSNAGIYRWGAITDTTVEEWDQQFDINLKSMFLVTQAVLPSMMEHQPLHLKTLPSIRRTMPANGVSKVSRVVSQQNFVTTTSMFMSYGRVSATPMCLMKLANHPSIPIGSILLNICMLSNFSANCPNMRKSLN